MNLRKIWLSARLWVAKSCQPWLKKRPATVAQGGQIHASGRPEPAMQTAIFCKKPEIGPSKTSPSFALVDDEIDFQQQLEEAIHQALRSLTIRGRLLDRDHLMQMATCLNEQAALEKDRGRYQLAEALIQRSLDIFDKTVVPDHPQLVPVLRNYADLLHRAGRTPEAAHLEDRAAAIEANRLDANSSLSVGLEADWRIQKK
jgi:hypothetical protein